MLSERLTSCLGIEKIAETFPFVARQQGHIVEEHQKIAGATEHATDKSVQTITSEFWKYFRTIFIVNDVLVFHDEMAFAEMSFLNQISKTNLLHVTLTFCAFGNVTIL